MPASDRSIAAWIFQQVLRLGNHSRENSSQSGAGDLLPWRFDRRHFRDGHGALELQIRLTGSFPSQSREVAKMDCVLMHKNVPAAHIELDDASGFILRINSIFSAEHLPVGVAVRKGAADRAALNDWWTERSIPASRSGVREALEALEISTTRTLLVRCLGLSLSDQYWILPDGADLTWAQINFFHNAFSDDIGDVLFGDGAKQNALDFSSPDSTSDGNLKKRWKIIEGKRCLIKGGSNPFRQQPCNEVIATGIMERLGIPHVPYTLTWSKGAPYSVCREFLEKRDFLSRF